jgi:uncharacterized protein (TIGR03083 family)
VTTDDRELEGLDPYVLLDDEARRIDEYLSDLPDHRWDDPSRCAGWSVRDVLCHLAATERYHHACFDHTVASLLEDAAADDLDALAAWNEQGVRSFDGVPPLTVLARWRARNAETRSRFRAADGTEIDTSVGDYPARWQAFHVASELAVHADDIGAPAPATANRRAWRARVSRFALAEAKPDIAITTVDGLTTVVSRGTSVCVDEDVLIEGVAGRLPENWLDGESRTLLSATP